MNYRQRICILFVLLALSGQRQSRALEIYVFSGGSAQADGSVAKPYCTLPDAVEAVRALREAGNSEPAVIVLREGRHQLNQTLVLGMEDGSPSDSKAVTLPKYGAGEPSGPTYLTFAAYPGETPVVSAGMPVTGWQRLEAAPAELPAKAVSKVWVADIPTGVKKFHTLYDARGRLNRARGDGFLPTKNGNSRTLHFPEGALKNWDNLEDVEIQVRPGVAYEINMLPLESVDEATGIATTKVSAAGRMGSLPPYLIELMGDKAASVWVENILEELDEPGEWVVNTKTRKIYLWPSDPAADGSPRGILAPMTSELIRVEGSIDFDGPTDTPVCGIAFSGLTFSHADRWAWTSNEDVAGWGLQHAWDMFDKPTALLRFRGAEDCRVTACRFINSGGTGVRLDLHAQRNRIKDSEFAHLGEAGILLVGYGLGSKDTNHHNDIINNTIHHFSEITWQSPGFWAWQSGHNRIAHNEFSHSGYCSVVISTRSAGSKTRPQGMAQENDGRGRRGNRRRGGYEGWKLREKTMHSRHNLFEYNEISHSVQLLSDGNGIYISGTGTGNIIRYNYLHDNLSHSIPAAIRCDDDQHETLIYGNVLYNNAGHAAGIASKGVNDIINNFIVAPRRVPRNGYISFEWAPVTGSKVQRNIVISHPNGGKAQSERLRRGQTTVGPKLESTDMDKNLYYHPTDSHWMDEHLLKMRAVGKEKASRFGDPMFKDPAAGDFSFRPGSPALTLGIEPLDVSKMGRLITVGKDNSGKTAPSVWTSDQDADYGSTERTKSFEGTWGIRILLPTSQDPKTLDSFDVPAFIKQVTQLKSISYVMINIHNGHYGSYHNAPHPELQAVLGSKHFPDRDLFGEVADALKSHNLKVLVYFSAPGFDWAGRYVPNAATKGIWNDYIKSKSMSHWDAVAELIVKFYSDKYGDKIDGWWFDRTKRVEGALTTDAEYRTMARAARSRNPNSILAFHYSTGPVNRGTPYCDYAAGHPHPMKYSKGPWDKVNLRMVTAIEKGPFIKGPFINDKDKPTANPDEGTLGQIFMPFQRNWKNGAADFPTDQAHDWMTRVLNAGGFYTWAVARTGGLFAAPQFNQLLEMDATMEPVDISP